MSAESLVQEGRLKEALTELQADVRRNPADPRLRTFLFQLLAVLGQSDRALNQLQVAGELDKGNGPMVQTYREVLQCEALRGEVMSGARAPLVLGEPAQWIAELLEALRLSAGGHGAEAAQLREQVFEAAPATAGTIDGQEFAWIADADVRFGPVLEAIVNGAYRWIPFERIASIVFEAPKDLRDLVWLPAWFTWANGGTAVGFVPSRYPDRAAFEDGRLALARATDWEDKGHGLFVGRGQRMLTTDIGEFPLLETRSIVLRTDTTHEASPDA